MEQKIRHRLSLEAPGWEAQKLMSPVGNADPYRILPEQHLKASVVLMLYPENGGVKSIFIERSHHPEDKHSGQISLPGGKLEEGENYEEAAKREVFEEIGIIGSQFEIIGSLSPLYVYVSNFLVQPYVAWTNERPETSMQLSEVSDVLHVDVNTFLDERHRRLADIPVRNSLLKDVPYFDINGRVLWGATAMIMSEFSEVMKL